jgi:hypothetical protein
VRRPCEIRLRVGQSVEALARRQRLFRRVAALRADRPLAARDRCFAPKPVTGAPRSTSRKRTKHPKGQSTGGPLLVEIQWGAPDAGRSRSPQPVLVERDRLARVYTSETGSARRPLYLWAAIGGEALLAASLPRKAALCESLSLRFFFHGRRPRVPGCSRPPACPLLGYELPCVGHAVSSRFDPMPTSGALMASFPAVRQVYGPCQQSSLLRLLRHRVRPLRWNAPSAGFSFVSGRAQMASGLASRYREGRSRRQDCGSSAGYGVGIHGNCST